MTRRLGLGFAAVFASVATANPAQAADPIVIERQLTDGVDRPIHDIAGEGDASSAEVNPALVGDVRGVDLTVLGTHSFDAFGRGDGVGAFWAVNLVRFLALGFGAQMLRPQFDGGRWDYDAAQQRPGTKIGFTLATGDSRHATVGFAVNGLRTRQGWLRGADLDLGALIRGGNYFSLGAVAKLAPVSLSADSGYRPFFTVDTEVAIRPLGTRWVELAGGIRARMDQANGRGFSGFRDAINGHARIGLRWQGLGLHGELEQVPVVSLDEDTLELSARGSAWRGGIAIDYAFDYGMASAGMSPGPNQAGSSLTLKARVTSQRQGRGYWARPVDADRFDLSAIAGERSLLAVLERLRRAEKDGDRSVLVLDARGTGLGWASLQELRAAVVRARNAGAHVFAYVEDASIKDLYVASAAESVFVHHAGELAPYGLTSTSVYLRDALAKLGVKVEAMAIREYKSAHEMFSRADRSAKDREQRTRLMQVAYEAMVHDVAQGRGLSLAETRALFDESPHTPQAALELGLVDGIIHRDELVGEIEAAIGTPVRFQTFRDRGPSREVWGPEPYFAVVLVEGAIVDGKSVRIPFLGINFTGGDTLASTLRTTRGDPACQGIVLRVNSPGGSPLASEVIWREAARTHEAWRRDPARNPPIVVSMSDAAASGGYYVAASGAEIFAQPTTITGSIGVVATHWDVSGLLSKLGVGVDTITLGRNPDIGSVFKPYTADQRQRLERSMQNVYDLFRRRVSDARGLEMERVDEIGRGHVWSGLDAKDLGLVDELGGLEEAVDRLEELVDAPRYRPIALRVLPKRSGLLGLLLDQSQPFTQIIERKVEARRSNKRGGLERVANWALAELPLTFMLLPQDKAQTIMDASIAIE